uniref:Large ribosomal subunit protein uL6c n=1 Tax=Dicranema revolutum TaxID=239144 RepID=A0A4D6WRB2_9FLOR|nr:ribosomal protein L6 [Dicranema revolutum]
MSRIGKKTISLTEKIKVSIIKSQVTVEGPKGKLSQKISDRIQIEYNSNQLKLKCNTNEKEAKALYGLSRTLINNMVIGVSKGFEKKLEIQGVGYRGQIDGKRLILNLGYSHPIVIDPPPDINIEVENNTNIIISGINKETVGQIAAKIKKTRPPEPYKGKGIRYLGEIVKRKVGKAKK